LIAPVITGNEVGVAITSTNGTWTGSPTSYSYKWQVSDDGSTGWADISGATSATYTPVSGDEDKYVRLQVTATNSNGSSLPAYSAASDQIEVPAFPSGAIAFWKLSDLTDASGNGNTLTNNNTVTFAAGKIGNAAVMDGADQYLSRDSFAIGTAYTQAVWFKLDAISGTHFILDNKERAMLYINSDGDFRSSSYDLSLTGVEFTPASTVVEGQWHHAAFVYNGTSIKLYFDGALVATETFEIGDSAIDVFAIGSLNYGLHYFDGQIDAVGIWDRALSDGEIATLYNSGTGLEPA
jgi:hypothetical protein